MMVAVSSALAQTSGSASIQKDVRSILNNAEDQLFSTSSSLVSAVKNAATAFNKAMIRARSVIVALFKPLGTDGQTLTTLLDNSVVKSASDLTIQFENQVSQVQQAFENIQKQMMNQVQGYTNKLRNTVYANPSAYKCWTDNVDKIRSASASTGQQILSAVSANIESLATQNSKLVKSIDKTAQKIEADVVAKCGTTKTCILNYVS